MFQVMVCASGVVAFLVNLSIFWIIGNTSPLTYPFCCIICTGIYKAILKNLFLFFFDYPREIFLGETKLFPGRPGGYLWSHPVDRKQIFFFGVLKRSSKITKHPVPVVKSRLHLQDIGLHLKD